MLLLTSQLIVYELETHGKNYIDLSPEWTKLSEALLLSAFEKVIVASSPLQSFLIQLRDISQWKSPRRSAAWMVVYFICLFYSQITRMAVCYPLTLCYQLIFVDTILVS